MKDSMGMNNGIIRWLPSEMDPVMVEWGEAHFLIPLSDWFEAVDKGNIHFRFRSVGKNKWKTEPVVDGEWLSDWIYDHPGCRLV